MTTAQTIYKFWSGFGIPAYEENSVPIEAKTPYITYEYVEGADFGDTVAMTASVWYRSTKWTEINLKVYEIFNKLNCGGKLLICDEGAIWLRTGIPFAQNMGDESDELIRRKYINLTVEFLR